MHPEPRLCGYMPGAPIPSTAFSPATQGSGAGTFLAPPPNFYASPTSYAAGNPHSGLLCVHAQHQSLAASLRGAVRPMQPSLFRILVRQVLAVHESLNRSLRLLDVTGMLTRVTAPGAYKL